MVVSTPFSPSRSLTRLLERMQIRIHTNVMPEPHLDNRQQPTDYQFPCFTLGFNFDQSQESYSGSNDRLSTASSDSSHSRIHRQGVARPYRKSTISQALAKTTSTDRVPELHPPPPGPSLYRRAVWITEHAQLSKPYVSSHFDRPHCDSLCWQCHRRGSKVRGKRNNVT
jgi:hypothetical protein